jgi:chromosome condensin MukBEF ATPase and DNA-binding subunit MukB
MQAIQALRARRSELERQGARHEADRDLARSKVQEHATALRQLLNIPPEVELEDAASAKLAELRERLDTRTRQLAADMEGLA